MKQPDANYPDVLSPDSTESRRRVVEGLILIYGSARASSSLDARVFDSINGMEASRKPRQHRRHQKLLKGALLSAAISAVVILLIVMIGSHGARHLPPNTSGHVAAAAHETLNRAAGALPRDGRVARLTYAQSFGLPGRSSHPIRQRVYIWEAAVPGGYAVAGSQTPGAAANVAEIRLKGRLHRLTHPAPILGVLDGPGDARMLRAALLRSPGSVTAGRPEEVGGRRVIVFRLGLPLFRKHRPGAKDSVWFAYEVRSSVLAAAGGNGWSARLVGRADLPFFSAPRLIRQLLRPDISGMAPAY